MQTCNIRLDIPDTNQHLEIQLDPFLCQLKANHQTNPIWQLNKIQFRSAVGDWQGVDLAKKKSLDNISCELELFSGRQLVYNLQFFLQNGLFNLQLSCKQKEIDWVAVDFAADQEEHFVGFGERFDAIDQRGKELDLWVEDGATQGITYIPLPFFMSSNGYATLINSSHRIIARMATHDNPGTVSLRVSEANPSFTIFCGGSFQKNLSKYTAISGRPELPPAWVFGPWKSRDWQTADQQGIVEDIQQQISLGLPATVKLIDARWEVAYHSFRFDPIKFPDPRAT
jgi:alpha-D-xyloside xylohydrolase